MTSMSVNHTLPGKRVAEPSEDDRVSPHGLNQEHFVQYDESQF